MFLKGIQLVNFKNYAEASVDFAEKVNAVVGENGSGKTNLLDAIHYLSFCKSYFSAHDHQSIRFDSDFFAIHGEYVGYDDGRTCKISCIFKRNGRKMMKLNAKEYERLSDHIGQYPLIMVAPVDSNLIHEGSELRRKFFDMIISQFDKEYLHILINYQKLLGQRNALLKQMFESGQYDASYIQIYDSQLIPLNEAIFAKRADFLTGIQPVFQQYYNYLSDNKEIVQIDYLSTLKEMPIAESFQRNVQADYSAGYTTAGIHKDDFNFLMNGNSLKRYSSQGQQKSFLLALKLSQFDYYFERKKMKPILLLDDIFDKLDEKRTSRLLQLVGDNHFGQVFLSDTDRNRIDRILNAHQIQHKILEVNGGRISSPESENLPKTDS